MPTGLIMASLSLRPTSQERRPWWRLVLLLLPLVWTSHHQAHRAPFVRLPQTRMLRRLPAGALVR